MVLVPASRRLSSSAASGTPEAAIARIHAAFIESGDACNDTFKPSLGEDGILLLDLGDKGQYSLQAADGGQLLLFSALSGPKYYTFDAGNGWWVAKDDGHVLDELLVRELMRTCPHGLKLGYTPRL